MTGKIFFIMGVSGAGKGTLIENLKKQDKINLEFVRSYVTRDIRHGEIDGNIYHFISMDEFKRSIEAGEFLEYKFVHNLNYYGTKKKDVIDNGIEKGKILIKEIDIEGLKEIYTNHPELKPYIKTIFLSVSKETFKKRVIERQGDVDKTELENRGNSLEKERKEALIYCDYIIDSEKYNKDEVLNEVLEIISKNI
ncbi:MAG: guanylate kinase [Candidatus Gracilibacteria bacterium]|nr:guanylate kinase [Candidatus Gracilibacteria bacterium]